MKLLIKVMVNVSKDVLTDSLDRFSELKNGIADEINYHQQSILELSGSTGFLLNRVEIDEHKKGLKDMHVKLDLVQQMIARIDKLIATLEEEKKLCMLSIFKSSREELKQLKFYLLTSVECLHRTIPSNEESINKRIFLGELISRLDTHINSADDSQISDISIPILPDEKKYVAEIPQLAFSAQTLSNHYNESTIEFFSLEQLDSKIQYCQFNNKPLALANIQLIKLYYLDAINQKVDCTSNNAEGCSIKNTIENWINSSKSIKPEKIVAHIQTMHRDPSAVGPLTVSSTKKWRLWFSEQKSTPVSNKSDDTIQSTESTKSRGGL